MEEIAEQVISICDKHGKPEMIAELLLCLGLDEIVSTDEEYEPTDLEKTICADIDIESAEEEEDNEVIIDKDGFCSLK